MRIAIDGFGGDNAPAEVIKGAAAAVKEYGVEVAITGDEQKLRACFKELGASMDGITIVDADGVIEIEDNPMDIRKAKANSSMGKAFQLVVNGEADAFVSAGSTAALVVGGSMVVGRIKGVKRPALAPVMPSISNYYMLLDGGANLECRPEMLQQFAVMGSIYMDKIMNCQSPRVGLLNIGAEEEKGRELEHETYALLKNTPLNFIGNVEAREVPLGACDVIVTDGFTGNIFLKTVEGMGRFMKRSLKETVFGGGVARIGAVFAMGGIKKVSKNMDYKEVGGSPLLGTQKPVIKAHGSSDEKAFKNAIRQAKEFVENNVISEIEASLADLKSASSAE